MLGENLSNQVSTPKMWKDLTADEKVERMRQEIKNFGNQLGNIQATLHQIRNDFAKHEHSNGKIMTPHEAFGSSGLVGSAKALYNPKAEAEGNVYF